MGQVLGWVRGGMDEGKFKRKGGFGGNGGCEQG